MTDYSVQKFVFGICLMGFGVALLGIWIFASLVPNLAAKEDALFSQYPVKGGERLDKWEKLDAIRIEYPEEIYYRVFAEHNAILASFYPEVAIYVSTSLASSVIGMIMSFRQVYGAEVRAR